MKLLLVIPITFLLSSQLFSQTVVADSTWTFTAQLLYDNPCSPASGKAFKVVNCNYKLPIDTIFISANHLSPGSWLYGTTYTIKGFIKMKTEWRYGCYDSRWEEQRVYVIPTYFFRQLKASDLDF